MPKESDLQADRDVRELCFETLYRKPMTISGLRFLEDIQESGLLGVRTAKELYDKIRYKTKYLINCWPESIRIQFTSSFKVTHRSMILSRDATRYINFICSFFQRIACVGNRTKNIPKGQIVRSLTDYPTNKPLALVTDFNSQQFCVQHADKIANMISRLEHVSHLGPPWLLCTPLISISLMQLVVGHCYIHYKILHDDSDSIIQAQGYDFMVKSSNDRVLDNAIREMQSVRKADLQECDDENIEHTELPRSVFHIIELTKQVLLAMNDTLPMTATISDTYRQEIRQGWSNGSGAVYRDRKWNADCTFNL